MGLLRYIITVAFGFTSLLTYISEHLDFGLRVAWDRDQTNTTDVGPRTILCRLAR